LEKAGEGDLRISGTFIESTLRCGEEKGGGHIHHGKRWRTLSPVGKAKMRC